MPEGPFLRSASSSPTERFVGKRSPASQAANSFGSTPSVVASSLAVHESSLRNCFSSSGDTGPRLAFDPRELTPLSRETGGGAEPMREGAHAARPSYALLAVLRFADFAA